MCLLSAQRKSILTNKNAVIKDGQLAKPHDLRGVRRVVLLLKRIFQACFNLYPSKWFPQRLVNVSSLDLNWPTVKPMRSGWWGCFCSSPAFQFWFVNGAKEPMTKLPLSLSLPLSPTTHARKHSRWRTSRANSPAHNLCWII